MLKDIQRKKRRRMIVINSIAVLGAAALFTLLGFVGKEQNEEKCWKIEVKVLGQNNQYFVDSTSISNALLEADPQLIGKPMGSINLGALHSKLVSDQSIREAHVVTSVDGRLLVEVVQRNPIARIINADGIQFYLDAEGFSMPLSQHYTAKVPVFTGNLHEQLQEGSVLELGKDSTWAYSHRLDEIYYFTQYIRGNEFWNAMVEHVHFSEGGKMEIIPRVGNQRLVIGDISDLGVKLKRLMTFYANVMPKEDLNQYAAIDVEYDGQIVCVKR